MGDQTGGQLPTAWDPAAGASALLLEVEGTRTKYTGARLRLSSHRNRIARGPPATLAACARAGSHQQGSPPALLTGNRPVPGDQPLFYFELEVVSGGRWVQASCVRCLFFHQLAASVSPSSPGPIRSHTHRSEGPAGLGCAGLSAPSQIRPIPFRSLSALRGSGTGCRHTAGRPHHWPPHPSC